MSAKHVQDGNCYDNSVMENFFGYLKSELLYLHEFESVEHFKAKRFVYIDCYNNRCESKQAVKGRAACIAQTARPFGSMNNLR